jgi:glycosyltransferase involved in cell wall biosynthesis
MTDRVNILFMIDCLYGFSGGGTERHLSYLASHLNKERYKPHVVAFDMGDSPIANRLRAEGVEVIHLPVSRYYTPQGFLRGLELAGLLKRLKIDIVQTFHFKADTYGALVAWLAGVRPILSSKRDIGDRKKRVHLLLHRLTRPCLSGWIAVADAVGESVIRKEGIRRDRIKVIYNGVDTERFRPADPARRETERTRLGLRKEDFVVGMVAVFRPEKNHELLFRAAKALCQEIPEIRVVCVGGGSMLDQYRSFCRENGLEGRVVFTGATDDVLPHLMTFDVGCLVPGSNEGFSNAILEKMAMGLPMVVSDVGGNREAVVDGWNGLVIPPHDLEALIRSIRALYEDRVRRNEMGMRSRKRAEETFGMERMIQEHEAYYDALMRVQEE